MKMNILHDLKFVARKKKKDGEEEEKKYAREFRI